jgi:hypothetical protein
LLPETDLDPASPRLRHFMNQLRQTSFSLSDRINQRFFSHAGEADQRVLAP